MLSNRVIAVRMIPVWAYSLLAANIPDIELKPFVVQGFDVEALATIWYCVAAEALPGWNHSLQLEQCPSPVFTCVGVTVVISSAESFFSMVVLPALSSPKTKILACKVDR